jgi:O-antigen/teichoic acid export membrane protein
LPGTTKDASTRSQADAGSNTAGPDPVASRAIDTGGRSLRSYAAHGVVVNAAFDIGLSLLSLIQGFVVAAFLTRSQYGVWGILVVSLGVLAQLKVVGIGEKYIQQNEPNQEHAFQKAFTLEVLVSAAMMIPLLIALPVIAVVYGHWELVPPGLVLVSVLVADALEAPFWIPYRSMDFARQRRLSAVEPVVAFIVTIALAIAGLGYWALALGVVVGAWAGALTAILTSPFPLRWRYDAAALRAYGGFSLPIFVATFCNVALANGTMIATNAHLGLAGAGALALASKITEFTTRLDTLLSGTLYPAICAIQDRLELLRETFVKANRLALMWAVPFGVGLAVFAGDLVRFVIGTRWEPAVGLLQIMGIIAAVNHIGFNWDDYYRARGQTRPVAITAVVTAVTMLGVGIPLLLADGLTGLGIGIAAGAALGLVVRAWYVARMFDGFRFAAHSLRAVLPTVPAAAAVLILRAADSSHHGAARAAVELAVYVGVTIAATLTLERPLLRESLGYITGRGQ